ncbi:hypothetical protein GQ53DRAFT_838611 [Thozetella sp. PMI_491]|nr:hypothetical protein GQ53DRAFT_838611 [Thozetella sp. PMI_491]
MHTCVSVKSNMKRFCARFHGFGVIRKRKEPKRTLEISAPFNFQKNETMLPGLSEDEVAMLREKAAASRLGIADHRDMNNPFVTANSSRASSKGSRSPPVSPVSPVSTLDLTAGSPVAPITPVMIGNMI